MDYRVLLSPKAIEYLSKVDKKLKDRLKAKMALLKEPYDVDCVKIKGRENSYRTRVGDYRILYSIYPKKKLVIIVRIDKRSRAYKR